MFEINNSKAFFRNQIVDFKDANLSISNTAFMYGLGVFSGIRGNWNNEDQQLYLFRLKENYRRLVKSCRIMGFKNFEKEFSESRFIEIIKELLKTNQVKEDIYIRPCVFIDDNTIGPKIVGNKDSLYIFLYPLGNYVSLDGIKCCVSSWRRVQDNAIPARAKVNGAYVNTALIKSEALSKGFDEAIVLDEDGHAVEGSAENLFLVRDNIIYTPGFSSDVLEGITRGTVIQIAEDMGYKIIERPIDRTELYTADEIFLSGTAAKVSPVIQVDDRVIGDGQVGKISKKLQSKFFDICLNKDENYSSWLTPIY